MLRNLFLWVILSTALIMLTGCTMNVDAPQTPTIIVSPTLDETKIAQVATDKPTVSPTNTATPTPSATTGATSTNTPTLTATASPSPSPTRTPTYTMTTTVTAPASSTLTVSPSSTATSTSTSTATFTATSSPTVTASATPRPTQAPTSTSSYTPTATMTPTTRLTSPTSTSTVTSTSQPTQTPTQPIAQLRIPTATPRNTMTFTPFPSITPNVSQTEIAHRPSITPTATATPNGLIPQVRTQRPTLTRLYISPTPIGDVEEENAAFFDPDAPAEEPNTLPLSPTGARGPSGPAILEQSSVVVSYAGQIVPIVTVPNGMNTGPAIGEGEIFTISSKGQVATIHLDGEFYIDEAQVLVSPASRFGLDSNLSYGDLAWSPNSQYVAIRVDAIATQVANAIDSGIWIYEPATNQSWQIFRNSYEGQVAQLHQQRRALSITWAPNSTALAITVATPIGQQTVFLPVDHNANNWVDTIPYPHATWTTDSAGLIVSGQQNDGYSVVGHVALDTNWTYTEYLNQNTVGLHTKAAIQLHDGRIAFLGGASPDIFALYTIQPTVGAHPIRVSQDNIGKIIATEWNDERNAVLITTQLNEQRQLWIIRTDGTVLTMSPLGDPLSAAHWR